MKIYVGSLGWSYPDWKGVLYPRNSVSSDWLYYYSKFFDYVEIDHTFYHTPDPQVVKKWSKITPPDFRFTIKFPRAITHSRRLADIRTNHLNNFFSAMSHLSSKNLSFLIQLPPSFIFGENAQGLKDLKDFASILDSTSNKHRYAIEFRDRSWFNDQTYYVLSSYDICMVWNQLHDLAAPPVCTSDFVYLHLIGDSNSSKRNYQVKPMIREFSQSRPGRDDNNDNEEQIRKDSLLQMQKWASELTCLAIKEERDRRGARTPMQFVLVSINNHYLGYGPRAINIFRRMIGLPIIRFGDVKQTTLFDFENIGVGEHVTEY